MHHTPEPWHPWPEDASPFLSRSWGARGVAMTPLTWLSREIRMAQPLRKRFAILTFRGHKGESPSTSEEPPAPVTGPRAAWGRHQEEGAGTSRFPRRHLLLQSVHTFDVLYVQDGAKART